MFGIDGLEFLVILLVLIVVVGPKDLPKFLKAMAKAIAYMRSTANEFRRQFDDAMKQAELDDLRKTFSDINNLNSTKKLTEFCDSIHGTGEEIRDGCGKNAAHHKSKKDEEFFRCDQDKVNEDLKISIDHNASEGRAATFKNKKAHHEC
ncbi:sec-independent protein translocase protein TatB [Bartonella japonica]|uniref:Sec-independent protein translocase protein TatB n=1 Tax=Bartonella japonica TaxID=357761 RepID=A0ABV2FPK3_9HYPH